MSECRISSFKGSPVIELDSGSKYPFSFGIKKAALVVEHIDAIRRFVNGDNNGGGCPDPGELAEDRFNEKQF
jgi:hypothetical protein